MGFNCLYLCRLVVRVVLAVPTTDPIELTGDSRTAPELLALPISAGGFAMPLFVERFFLRHGGQHQSRLGPAFCLPALEGRLAAATATCPRVVHAAWALARLAGWQIPVRGAGMTIPRGTARACRFLSGRIFAGFRIYPGSVRFILVITTNPGN